MTVPPHIQPLPSRNPALSSHHQAASSHAQDVVVTGGPVGVSARLETMYAAADVLAGAAHDLEAVLGRLFRAELDLHALALGLAPATGLDAEAAVARFFLLAAGTDLKLHGTAAGVRASAGAYEAAEAFIAASFEFVMSAAGNVLGHSVRALVLSPAGVLVISTAAVAGWTAVQVGTIAWEGAQELGLVDAIDRAFGIDTATLAEQGMAEVQGWAGRAAAEAAHRAGENSAGTAAVIEHVLPGFAAGLLGYPPGATFAPVDSPLIPKDSRTLTGLLLVGLSRLGLFGDQPLRPGAFSPAVDVRAVKGATPPAERAPARVGELWQRQWARSRGLDNGQVRVEQIRDAGGRSRWIVYVPATTSGALTPDRSTSDMTSNLETASGRRSAQHETVTQAMKQAGVPRGEQVMMVGYSQGGIVAASLIEDEGFREDYEVSAFFTVGSPVSDFDIPEGVDTLSVEHEQDLIPVLDGDPNPDRTHWTTVRVDLDAELHRRQMADAGRGAEEIGEAMAGPLYAHGGEFYTRTIDDLESGGEPGLNGWRERNAGFFDGEVVETSDFEGRRP